MFIGENLTNLRIMHGYSRKQLSEMLNITEQAVWQYENNYTFPKLQIVNDLKNIFNVKSKYFYKNDALKKYATPENIPVMNIAYRSKVLNIISKTQTEAKHIAFLDSFVNYVTANLTLPTQKIIQLRDELINYLNNTIDDRNIQINNVAKLARHRLGVSSDTNDYLLFNIEKNGVFIFEKPIGEDIDAYSLWTNKERPFIILGNLKRSAVRRNFDIAHELGHLLLHYKVEFTNLNRKEHKAIENEANLFAGCFLLPEKAFLEDMEAIASVTNPDAYMDLKNKWKVSLQVLGYRAANLGLMDAREHRNFYAALHRKGYLKREPLDEAIPIQKPQKVKTIIDFIANKGMMDIQEMAERDWMVNADFFYRLTGIDKDFFSNYMTEKQDFSISNAKVCTPTIHEQKV
ncbi:helix-turn-helix domain-containing protein [Virgibacillus halodenitrificans]|uniref:spr1629 family repressor/antitoxin n=1 Tax=Virgibacillus halodenitrificans TaxID=1482 RepID=UPI0002F52E78|nr:XRE family transcriptional regulator [Virgibacillus halodenitrificans]MCJ0931507.1 XRE family transcriptional regulator [Virgibacillus halodenitrificans]WHX25670.1 XRE family transcriptional regulator [Virgibacillus halodenitrificans]